MEWIKRNEALLIEELETRRQAGLPIQVVVRVEKITPSMPEYCQIIPDFCHLDVIKEETSASDEDPKKEVWEHPEEIRKTNNFKKLPDDVDEEKNGELENISEVSFNETVISECHLERLESPSLVRESEILRFADIITTENECVVELETLEPLKKLSLVVNNIEINKCTQHETSSVSSNNLNSKTHENDYTVEEHIQNDEHQIYETIDNSIIENCNREQNTVITNLLLEKDRSYVDDAYYKTNNSIEVTRVSNCKDQQINKLDVLNVKSQFFNNCCISTEPKCHTNNMNKYNELLQSNHHVNIIEVPHQENTDKHVHHSEVLSTKSLFINSSTSAESKTIEVSRQENTDKRVSYLDILNNKYSNLTEPKSNMNRKKYNAFSKNEHHVKIVEVSNHGNTAEHEESSDDSTIKTCDIYNYKYKPRNQNKVSINDKLKQIARLLQDETDDYEEIQSLQANSRCVSIASDADVDTDWVSFTLSDGESSKSLCLSPSQLRSSHAPSTATKTSEIIDLHNKFRDRTRSENLLSRQDIAPVEILGFDYTSPSPSPSKSYTSEVVDEACRMCGTSDEPLSDAECLVSLRKYRETRSRLLDVIQKERRLDRSVIDRPSAMPTFIDTLSVPDNHTRELMYTEYMEKVKERENRLHNKVIRITKASRPLSSGSLQAFNDVDAEFLTKARERLEKLGFEADVDIVVNDEYYPRHLVDIVPEDEVCIEEVHMNGESSGFGVCTVFFLFLCLFFFINTVFAVWPSLITLLRYESAEGISKISYETLCRLRLYVQTYTYIVSEHLKMISVFIDIL